MTIGTDFLQNSKNNSSSDSDDANFDTNMVIILAALLCALICALGLNTIVRCALRCGHRVAMEQQLSGQAATSPGLKKRSLRKIPVEVYGPGTSVPATECPICLGDFADGEKVRVLPKCHHGFHVRCIDTWLAAHPSCPTCRSSIVDRTDDDKGEASSQELSPTVPAHVIVEISEVR
ncbi:RING-H2 finger protein ATL72 [Rhynchospora pubera]|uniref:RING-H2 finger protein ATL72 n=1 Tax=Rhynchospora pubera TaxID=906938 RepID=A0AAV8E0N1_9POAL|nr:RING-H2 finger protein ATL72 [Rhynchospora pubera]KAJ4780013.1 RING-H2 finger protein ATL72 [Rhynchospora pubera]